MSTLADAMWALLPAPLRRSRGELWRWVEVLAAAYGEAFDAIAAPARNRHPISCADGVLPILGEDRELPQLPGESLDEWRLRLRQAFALHQEGGTNAGVERVLRVFGFEDPAVYEHRQDAVRYNGSHSFDGEWTYGGWWSWAHFSVLLEAVAGGVSAELLATVRAAIRKHKAGHAVLAEIRLTQPAMEDTVSVGDELELGVSVDLEDDWGWSGARYDGAWPFDGLMKYSTSNDELVVTVS